MPQDFRSLREAAQTIGFHELRQACEISTLRQDLEHAHKQADALRSHIETTVEQVRARISALTADDLADSATMAPLLQDAVAQLIAIRDAARRTDRLPAAAPHPPVVASQKSAGYGDAERPAAPSFTSPPPLSPPPLSPQLPFAAEPPPVPEIRPSAPTPQEPPGISWLLPTAPPPVRPVSTRSIPTPATPNTIDWLKPLRR